MSKRRFRMLAIGLCPDLMHRCHQGKCYRVMSSGQSWCAAGSSCVNQVHPRSHLVDITSLGERDFVISAAESEGVGRIWTSEYQVPAGNAFQWSNSGNLVDTGIMLWGGGQPDYGSQKCIVFAKIYDGGSWRIHDAFCSYGYHYICELNLKE